MRSMTSGIGLLVGVLLAVSHAQAQGAGDDRPKPADQNKPASQEQAGALKPQTTCPVMGGAIDKNQYVDHEGKRVYICCKGCEAPLRKDPAKYIKKLEAAGIVLAPADKTGKAAEL